VKQSIDVDTFVQILWGVETGQS